MAIEIPKDSWPGEVLTVTLGATSEEGGTRTSTVTVGGEKSLPFMHFESEMPNRPVIAVEIKDRKPDGWSELLMDTWGDSMEDPGKWAKAAEDVGAELIQNVTFYCLMAWQLTPWRLMAVFALSVKFQCSH